MNKRNRRHSLRDPEPLPIGEDSIEEVSLDELEEEAIQHKRDLDAEMDERIFTKYTDGSTTNPADAQEQGLVYDSPDDPPVLPSDDLQGAEIGVGFASSMEESDPDVEILPGRVNNNDLDLEDDILTVLRLNSETAALDDVTVQVQDGVAYVQGTVASDEDLALVQGIIADLDGVVDVVLEVVTK
ncbi:MAG: BON domain-containing protein [Caldilineaceae bacterium]